MGFYDFYTAGQINGKGAVLVMFRIFRADRSFGSCHVVESDKAAANRDALRRMGYQPLA